MNDVKPRSAGPATAKMKRYYVCDPRQRSVISGKPDGGWLRTPPTAAVWVRTRHQAESFTAEEIEAMKKQSPYLEGCEIVPADDAG